MGKNGEINVNSVKCICSGQPGIICTNSVSEDGTGFIELGVPEAGTSEDSVVCVAKLQIELAPSKVIPCEIQLYSPGKVDGKTYNYPTFKGIGSSTASGCHYLSAQVFLVGEDEKDNCYTAPEKVNLDWDSVHNITDFSLVKPVAQNITQWEHLDLVFPKAGGVSFDIVKCNGAGSETCTLGEDIQYSFVRIKMPQIIRGDMRSYSLELVLNSLGVEYQCHGVLYSAGYSQVDDFQHIHPRLFLDCKDVPKRLVFTPILGLNPFHSNLVGTLDSGFRQTRDEPAKIHYGMNLLLSPKLLIVPNSPKTLPVPGRSISIGFESDTVTFKVAPAKPDEKDVPCTVQPDGKAFHFQGSVFSATNYLGYTDCIVQVTPPQAEDYTTCRFTMISLPLSTATIVGTAEKCAKMIMPINKWPINITHPWDMTSLTRTIRF